MEQKKLYVKPEETVVEMKTQQILCTSGDSNSDPHEDARVLDFTDTEELN